MNNMRDKRVNEGMPTGPALYRMTHKNVFNSVSLQQRTVYVLIYCFVILSLTI